MHYREPQIPPGDAYRMTLVKLEVHQEAEESLTLQDKVELLVMFCRLRSVAVVAHHIKINEPSVRIIIKREKKNL